MVVLKKREKYEMKNIHSNINNKTSTSTGRTTFTDVTSTIPTIRKATYTKPADRIITKRYTPTTTSSYKNKDKSTYHNNSSSYCNHHNHHYHHFNTNSNDTAIDTAMDNDEMDQ